MSTDNPITPLEYERVFRVLHTVSKALDKRPGTSCLFYNPIGAYLLESVLGVKAHSAVGGALFRVDDPTSTVLAFADVNGPDAYISSENGFHCWVQTETHIIDFTRLPTANTWQPLAPSSRCPEECFRSRRPPWRSALIS